MNGSLRVVAWEGSTLVLNAGTFKRYLYPPMSVIEEEQLDDNVLRFTVAHEQGTETFALDASDVASAKAVARLPRASRQPPAHRPDQAVTQVDGSLIVGQDVVGTNGTLRISGGMIVIIRHLKHDLLFENQRGTKTIPIRSVQAVQLKKARGPSGGAIEFVVAGDRSNTALDRMNLGSDLATLVAGRGFARAASENTVTFSRKQEPPFLLLHDYLIATMSEPTRSAEATPAASPAIDVVSKLERLRQLHSDGALTDDEFGQAKARLLGED